MKTVILMISGGTSVIGGEVYDYHDTIKEIGSEFKVRYLGQKSGRSDHHINEADKIHVVLANGTGHKRKTMYLGPVVYCQQRADPFVDSDGTNIAQFDIRVSKEKCAFLHNGDRIKFGKILTSGTGEHYAKVYEAFSGDDSKKRIMQGIIPFYT